MATQKGVWDVQEVRDKQLADEWTYKYGVGDAGSLYAWGRGYRGCLGLNQTHDFFVSSPTQIPGNTWILSNTGRDGSHFNVTKSDGTLWSWGYNEFGQLGQNSITPGGISSPVQVGTDTTWASGGSGKYNTSRGVKTDGTLWTWGRNLYGQLGQNTPNNTYQSSPVQLPGTTWGRGVTKNNSSYLANANIKTDGTLWIWGYGQYGKLAQNNTTQHSSPVQVPGTTWSTISGSYQSFLATKTDGTLWGWGMNYRGNLALNNEVKYSSPTQIGTDTTWSKFGGSNGTVSAIKTDGTLWTWGQGYNGNLGNNTGGSGNNASSPVQVGTDTTWNLLGGGSLENLATKSDGTLWAWGSNSYGGLGQNSRINRSSPTQIPGTGWIFTKGGLVNLATKAV